MKIQSDFSPEGRQINSVALKSDLVVIGGGLSGLCAAITAARKGVKVVMVQDRPVLGGNSSSEVRLWVLGATSHLGNNNRWSREGGVIDELLVENTYINKEGNPLIFDAILLDKVRAETNITLLLNTAVYEVEKSVPTRIDSIKAFCSQNSTEYQIKAPLFCDASGDGIVGFLSGAAFRMGAESKNEFGEKFAPTAEYGELLGHSLYFYSKDTGRPVKFTAPSFAMDVSKNVPRFKSFNANEYGCRLWWLEYGGRLDTVHDTEQIKWELWKVVYGAWDYIKNSGNFPEAENLTLEWVGTIPGKRESRRFEGDYILRQQDIVEQSIHEDAVAYGGWSIDLHPADGVFSEKPGCNQWHSKGIYQIPYRCLYSRNIENLFLAGRIISASHVAFASTRVMATSAHVGQAVGMAAYLASQKNINPAQLLEKGNIKLLQQELLKSGQHIPGLALHEDENDLVQKATITASSEFKLQQLSADLLKPLNLSIAQMLPLKKGEVPKISLDVLAETETVLEVELRISHKNGNYTPDVVLEKKNITIAAGQKELHIIFSPRLEEDTYAFVVFHKNENVKLFRSNQRVTGILSVFNLVNKAVSNFGKQKPTEDIGVDEFEFWCPQRRPEGHNLAIKLNPTIKTFGVQNIKTGIYRPTTQPNAWLAALQDENPQLTLTWQDEQQISKIDLFFDTDYDHPMETVLMGHPEDVMPFCVRNYVIKNNKGEIIYRKTGNYQTQNNITFNKPIITNKLIIELERPAKHIPTALFAVRCYKN